MFYQVDRDKKHFKLSKGKEEKDTGVLIEPSVAMSSYNVKCRVQERQEVAVTPGWDTQVPRPLMSMTLMMSVMGEEQTALFSQGSFGWSHNQIDKRQISMRK